MEKIALLLDLKALYAIFNIAKIAVSRICVAVLLLNIAQAQVFDLYVVIHAVMRPFTP